MTAREAALVLYTSLTEEAETELEHAPLESINCEGGIQSILETRSDGVPKEEFSERI